MEESRLMTDNAKDQAPPAPEKPATRAEVKAEIKKLAEKLNHLEGQRRGGARERAPKARMLDATALEKKDPERHYRYENTDDPGRMQVMLDEGYASVPEKECDDAGVRANVGELRLIRVPREVHEEEVERQKELAKSRLEAHKDEVRGAVEAVARELRDRHGLNIPLDRLLVDE
jgi:hypothetical protein